MAQNRKYTGLPDLDEAQDIYETPELTENATLPSSTARSESQASSYGDFDNESSAIDRRNVRPSEARSHFKPSRVDARGVDFSDRIHRQRRSYRTRSARRRRGSGASDDELGDFSDEEDESLERKLARLRREVEEIKQEYDQRKELEKSAGGSDAEEDEEDPAAGIARLSEMLDEVYIQRQGGIKGAEAQFQRTLKRFAKPDGAAPAPTAPAPDQLQLARPSTSSTEQTAQALAKAADFDARLASLEKALGLNATNMPDVAPQPPKSILHALDTLERQLSTIADVSSSSLDAASRRVQKLTQEAERLDELRKAAKAAEAVSPMSPQFARARSGTVSGPLVSGPLPRDLPPPETSLPATASYLEDPERVAKINALYGTLGTIEALSPTLPLVLDRLRTLRLIHVGAGTASATLEELEKRQGEMEEELRVWREALEKVETNLKEGEDTLAGNVKTVGEWVRDLEARIARFG